MTNNGCMPISSNCVIWQGPRIPCLNLCKGDSITEVLYKFATDYCELLEQLDPTKYDLSCLSNINCPPETFSELIQGIIDKICDVEQQQGPPGPPGQDGADGINGNYVVSTNVPTGNPYCPCGGVKLQLFSGATNTLINQYYVCNGCDGDQGIQGPQGLQGPQGPQGLKGDQGDPGTPGEGAGILGFLSTSTDNNNVIFTTAPLGIRSVRNGIGAINFFPGFSEGTMVGTLDTAAGIWTAPATGWYNFNLLFSLSIGESPFNELTSTDNPSGFLGATSIGEFAIALIETSNDVVICSNTQVITPNTSHIIISATYTTRYITAGTTWRCKWLNKCPNNIKGQPGNSYHFTVTHLK